MRDQRPLSLSPAWERDAISYRREAAVRHKLGEGALSSECSGMTLAT